MKAGWRIYESPLGELTLVARTTGIAAVRFPGESKSAREGARDPMPAVVAQLDEYFAGERQSFDLTLDLSGSPFELFVWEGLKRIPYGETVSYGELAREIDGSAYPTATESHERARLVGNAVGRTPTPILVPCHRVVGADGSLVGYGGGLERKRALLDLEQGVTSLLV